MKRSGKSAPIRLDLNLQRFYGDLRTKKDGDKNYIFDPIRRRWIVLNPEEMVRQLLILHLLELSQPVKRLISVEKQIDVLGLKKRFDILIYDSYGAPHLLVECKAPGVDLNDEVFIQISNYNISLGVPFLLVTNGRDSYFCQINQQLKSYTFLGELNLKNLNFIESS